MAISRAQAVSVANDNANLAITSPSDVILVAAYNQNSVTIPTLVSGYTSLGTVNTSGQANAMILAYKVSQGGDTTTGVWTNATRVNCIVYRGVDPGTPFTNVTPNHGGSGSNVLVYKGFTLLNVSGNNWVAGFGGDRLTNSGMEQNTADLINVGNTIRANELDSNGGVTSFVDQSMTVAATAAWITMTCEVNIAIPTAGGVLRDLGKRSTSPKGLERISVRRMSPSPGGVIATRSSLRPEDVAKLESLSEKLPSFSDKKRRSNDELALILILSNLI